MDFDHTENLKKNYYNPVPNKHEQYKLRVPVEKPTKSTSVRKTSTHKLSFRPNFIHFLDASIMREFILRFHKKTSKRLNHLHDCVMVHPNDVGIFYDIVTEIYYEPRMKTLAQDLVFRRFKLSSVDSTAEKLE